MKLKGRFFSLISNIIVRHANYFDFLFLVLNLLSMFAFHLLFKASKNKTTPASAQ